MSKNRLAIFTAICLAVGGLLGLKRQHRRKCGLAGVAQGAFAAQGVEVIHGGMPGIALGSRHFLGN